MKICYIFGAWEIQDVYVPLQREDLLIAADGGYRHTVALGLEPDLIMGDFDSLDEIPVSEKVKRYASIKDDTDMMLAIREGCKRGYRLFCLFGGIGGRLDHTLANLQALAYLAARGARGYLVGDGAVVTVIQNDSLYFSAEKQGILSVFCDGDAAKGVSLKGLRYELSRAVLAGDLPLGVSNEFLGKPSCVQVEAGRLLVTWQEDHFNIRAQERYQHEQR